MDYLPVFLDLRGRSALVFGGSGLAARKVRLLNESGAAVRVIAAELSEDMQSLRQEMVFEHVRHDFSATDLDNALIAVVETGDDNLDREIANQCHTRSLPVNVVDKPALCSFILPSIVDRSPVMVAVSTSGYSPVLSRLLRARLEVDIPAAYGRLAEFAGEMRTKVKQSIADDGARRRFWEWLLDGPIASMVLGGQEHAARTALDEALITFDDDQPAVGEVYLVGAGPGDPELLTTRAVRLMGLADVVVHDRLVSDDVLRLTRRDARRIYAGKERSNHTLAQESINDLLVRLAKDGNRVLRLKGGDPFIFGRGGEEIDTLAANNVPFQVVPGITAASGCAAYAGIPLTHRDHAQSCVFVTGHLKGDEVNLDWKSLVKPQQTVVIYMGLVGLPVIARELIGHGMPSSTPAALVEHGTTAQHRVIVGTLETLPALVESHCVHAPTLTIVGEVVRLHEKLNWFTPAAG